LHLFLEMAPTVSRNPFAETTGSKPPLKIGSFVETAENTTSIQIHF